MIILIKTKKINSEDVPDNWYIWKRYEFDDVFTPDVYTDFMDEIVENYNRNFPEFQFEWYVER